ncbi:hypothetical protein P0M11_06745 [Kaistella sp. PBT33-4]|uniref:hypothetical protein n=1 Tax=Kaistella sp. PBT33-4 TaxID=3032000 RepID=UPI0023D7DB55|nr:hypothetical protein [Kaistella sp. PBT33-4]MDF0719696.1 hypothetical protein [Kaistella sp. PBT33-4]
MKKLNSIQKGFSSLENKKLQNLSKISGGDIVEETWTNEQTCGVDGNTPDHVQFSDDNKKMRPCSIIGG